MTPFKIVPAWITPDKQKVPLVKDWQVTASNDPAQLKKWMELYNGKISHWAIPAGLVNDILVLDVDVKDDRNGWKSVQENNLFLPDTRSQRTINGGTHLLYKYPRDGKIYRNRAGLFKKESGLDIRGQGGYIFFYGTDEKPIADAPLWLLNEAVKTEVISNGPSIKVSPEIANAMITASLEAIRDAAPGESNNTLNQEAFKIGQLIASGSITRQYGEEALYQAALERGKPSYEAKATIKSGIDGGLSKPLTSPFGEPVATILLPPPPAMPTRWTPNLLTREDLLNVSKLRKPQIFDQWSSEDITITTADGGTGKTTLKMHEAVCLALGTPFLGFQAKQQGKTLYITGEDTEKKLAAILGQVIREMGLFEPMPGNNEKIQTILDSVRIIKDSDLCLIAKDRATGFLYPSADAIRKVLEAVHDVQPKMIVFDPISSFWGSEAALNDMNKAVIKFMNVIVENTSSSVEMINHMGKQSSGLKDMTQFAGRGGTGLPSNSRISRTLRPIFEDEYLELTGNHLEERQSAMMCNVNKYTDGSPLYNKPFLILREGFLFSRIQLTDVKIKEEQQKMSDVERIFTFVKECRADNKYPTERVIIGNFIGGGDPISKDRCKFALSTLVFSGHLGERLRQIENPDMSVKDKAFVIVNEQGIEV